MKMSTSVYGVFETHGLGWSLSQ